jgi:hypothetical protein
MPYTANYRDDVFKSVNSEAFVSIPLDPANRHYQEVLDAIIEQGAACWDGDIPADIQAAADEKLFNQQLAAYRVAVARLDQYIVADGRAEETEEVVVGQQWNEETGEMVDITETQITVTAIDPVEPTVEQTTYDEEGNATTTTIENPLITKDNEERAAAQAVVDATPQAVKDAA